MSGLGPMLGKFCGAGGGCAHLGRDVLGDVEDFHAKVEGIAKAALELWSGEKEALTGPCCASVIFRVNQKTEEFSGSMKRIPSLDGLRAISFVLVRLSHLVKWNNLSLGLLQEYGARTLRLTKASSLISAVGPARPRSGPGIAWPGRAARDTPQTGGIQPTPDRVSGNHRRRIHLRWQIS